MSSFYDESDPAHEGSEKAVVIYPELVKAPGSARSPEAILEEACGLAEAIGLHILDAVHIPLKRLMPGTLLTKGHCENIAKTAEELEPDVIIVNHELSPIQQRNLEKLWNVKVIDRTGLILEIFGERAQTKEGRLQVELAAMEYQKSRLVRSWTHLERQRGGAGFMGGPGETQIEIDRRLIGERITKLKKEIERIRKTRELGQKSRERVPFPLVALVGYTNAGKSTLFNALTKAKVLAQDMLFATLDPTMRKIDLGGGQKVIISDTVGFISDLPTHLVAAFRATLEHIVQADVILHVMDVSQADYLEQKGDVIDVLRNLNINYEVDPRIIEVWNKSDLLEGDALGDLARKARFDTQAVLISALEQNGFDECYDKIRTILAQNHLHALFTIPVSDGAALAWLYAHCDILERSDGAESITMKVKMDPADKSKFESRFNYLAA